MKSGVACDACRVRKIKCDRLAVKDEPPPSDDGGKCTSCTTLDIDCTYVYKPKRRGPQPGQTRQKVLDGGHVSEPVWNARTDTVQRNGEERVLPDGYSGAAVVTDHDEMAGLWPAPAVSPEILIHHQHDGPMMPGFEARASPLFPSPSRAGFLGPSPSALSHHSSQNILAPSPGGEHFVDFLPRWLLVKVLDLFFESIYPLLPYPHKPTFLHDLHIRRETQPGQEEWTTMVVSVVGFTLVQVPNRLAGHSREQVRGLVERCYAYGRAFLQQPYKAVTIDRSIIFTSMGLMSFNLGFTLMSREFHGSNVALMLLLGLNRRQTYEVMTPLDREMNLRVWWLAYVADRSGPCIEGSNPLLHEDMCDQVDLPAMIDDEYLSSVPNELPIVQTPMLTGFHYVSKLWRATGRVLGSRIRDRDHTPTGPDIYIRLHQVDEFLRHVDGIMSDCPEELRLHVQQSGDMIDISTFLSENMDSHPVYSLSSLMLNESAPTGENVSRERCFKIMQANIYITQQALLFMGLQYRDELLALSHASHAPLAIQHWSSSRSWGSNLRRRSEISSREDKSAVLMDLLKIIQALPVDAIAVNSLPCLSKIRFVASELLNELEAPSLVLEPDPNNPSSEDGRQRAIEYLCADNGPAKYLSLLSEIENLYTLVSPSEMS